MKKKPARKAPAASRRPMTPDQAPERTRRLRRRIPPATTMALQQTTAPMVPTLFVFAATTATTMAESVLNPADIETDLEAAARAVAPIITRRGLIDGAIDLQSVAMDALERLHPRLREDEERYGLALEGICVGISHGLAAGYLITQMLREADASIAGTKGGAR